ncbi:MAG: glycosyltransferase [Bryobacteraceae bacterium]|jgi:glycosyltransferase involved in cell wall biosynthesis
MKIAIVASLFPPYAIGGAEHLAAQLAGALDRLGHQVDVISTCGRSQLGGQPYQGEIREGIRVWRVAPRNLYWSYDKQRDLPGRLARACWHAIDLWNPSVILPLRRVLDQIQPDVVNTHNIDGFSPAVWQVARKYTPAVAHTLHDLHLLCPRATMQRRDGTMCESLCRFCAVYTGYHRRFQKHVGMLIAPALATAELHRQAGWTEPRIEIIRNGVDVRPVPQPERAPSDPLRVLFLSRLEREKGCETLLASIPAFAESSEIEFHVAGIGTLEKQFTELAARVPNVTWHGFVQGRRKEELFSQCDVFLQLSECRENAPLSLSEAKAHGLYLVGTAVGGIPELIENSEAGQLIPPGDRQKLLASLERVCRSRGAIRRGRAARARRSAGYGTRQMAEAYVEAYRSLIAPPAAITNAATSHG